MKKVCFIISIVLCMSLLFSITAAFADDYEDDGILTLEEAKTLALKNDVRYNMQESYIQDAMENYRELSEESSINFKGASNVAEKAEARISYNVQLENAASNVRKAVLNKKDLKRASDYEVTDYFYSVINDQNSLNNLEEDLKLKKKNLETAEMKYSLQLITKASFSQAQQEYISSKMSYNKAMSEFENSMAMLGKNIGEDLEISNIRLDIVLNIPDINSIDLGKIKEDNLKNNLSYFTAREQYKLAEYKLALTEEKYDYYLENLKTMTASIEEMFDNMLFDTQKEFDNAEYSYNEKLDELEETINKQYTCLKGLYESYENLTKDLEDSKLDVEKNRIEYQMKLITKAALDSSEASLKKLETQLYKAATDLIVQYVNMTQYDLY